MDLTPLLGSLGILGVTAATALSDSIVPVPAWPVIGLAVLFWHPLLVFVAALAGSLVGMTTNYFIGYKGIRRLWIFKRNPKTEKRAEIWFRRWGPAILLTLTWIPLIGDPVTIVAGALRMPFKKFFAYILVAKVWTIATIIAIAYFSLGAVGWL